MVRWNDGPEHVKTQRRTPGPGAKMEIKKGNGPDTASAQH